MKVSKPFFLIILGRPGSGKGTQADLLEEKFGLEHISTGQLLRERAKDRDFVGTKLHEIMDTGKLVPTPLVFQLWMPAFEALHDNKEKLNGILFDGSPRKLYEAHMLDEVLEFYEWKDNVKVLNIGISPKESMTRLLKRGRHDDDEDDIQRRLDWFEHEVVPVLTHYKKQGMRIDINGEQSIEDVHGEILRKLKME